MSIDVHKEADKYAYQTGTYINGLSEAFIAGANSKYVQAKILQAQIDVLKQIDETKTNGPEHNAFYDLLDMKEKKISKLQRQLKQLQNE